MWWNRYADGGGMGRKWMCVCLCERVMCYFYGSHNWEGKEVHGQLLGFVSAPGRLQFLYSQDVIIDGGFFVPFVSTVFGNDGMKFRVWNLIIDHNLYSSSCLVYSSFRRVNKKH